MLRPTTQPAPRLRDVTAPGVAAVRANWKPFLLLQAAALAIVIAYYNVAPVATALDWLAGVKAKSGVAFAMIAAAVAGALLPEAAKALTQRGWQPDGGRLRELLFLLVFFPINGLIVDRFYALLADFFGNGNAWTVVLAKAAVDQFIFTPFISLPFAAIAFGWRRHGYRAGPLLHEIGAGPWRWYALRVMTLVVVAWCFWGPMVLLIYSLPRELQVVLWAGAMAAWSLLMVFIGNEKQPSDRPVPPPS